MVTEDVEKPATEVEKETPVEEAEYEPPDFLTPSEEETEEPPARRQPEPVETRSAGQPVEDEPWKPPSYTGDELYEKGATVIDGHVRQYAKPLAEALMAADARIKQLEDRASQPPLPHPGYVEDRTRYAASIAQETLREIGKEDKAFGVPGLRKSMEAFVRTQIQKGREEAKRGDFGTLNSVMDKDLLWSTWFYNKRRAKYTGEKEPVEVKGAALQPSRARQSGGTRRTIEDPDLKKYITETLGEKEEYYLEQLEKSEQRGRE